MIAVESARATPAGSAQLMHPRDRFSEDAESGREECRTRAFREPSAGTAHESALRRRGVCTAAAPRESWIIADSGGDSPAGLKYWLRWLLAFGGRGPHEARACPPREVSICPRACACVVRLGRGWTDAPRCTDVSMLGAGRSRLYIDIGGEGLFLSMKRGR